MRNDAARAALIVGSAAVYVVVFLPVYHQAGAAVGALSFVPICTAGWVLGWRGGLAAGVLVEMLNLFLFNQVGEPPWTHLELRWPGLAMGLVFGPMTGVLSELLQRTRAGAEQARRDHQALMVEFEERQRAEAAVREWKDRYEATVLASGHVLYDWDPASNTVTYAGIVERPLGYNLAEMGESREQWIELIHPEDRSAFRREIDRVLLSREPFHLEYRVRRKDGSFAFVRDDGYFIPNPDGGVGRMVGFMVDVTEHRNLEEQLRQAQKMEAVGRLAGEVAHDFNNLLTIINGYCEAMLTRLRSDDPAREMIRQVRRAGERAALLTQQLLAFSRRQTLAPVVLDLNALLGDLAKMLRRLIGEDIEVVSDLAADLGSVRADPGAIEQVVLNLAVNARDAMPKGGRLTVRTRNVALGAATGELPPDQPAGPYVLLEIGDTGCGMDETTRARAFEPFFTTKGPGQGTGLGLAMAYGVIRQSGGYIDVRSAPGQGSTFAIYLPRVQGPVPRRRSTSDVGVPPVGIETVLLVEDEDEVRHLAGMALKENGYNVLEARGGREALDMAQQYAGPIHLAVTDVVMPGMNGAELGRELAQLRPRIRILYVSGYTDDILRRYGVPEWGPRFLRKPYTPFGLARKIREVLDTKEGAAQLSRAEGSKL